MKTYDVDVDPGSGESWTAVCIMPPNQPITPLIWHFIPPPDCDCGSWRDIEAQAIADFISAVARETPQDISLEELMGLVGSAGGTGGVHFTSEGGFSAN